MIQCVCVCVCVCACACVCARVFVRVCFLLFNVVYISQQFEHLSAMLVSRVMQRSGWLLRSSAYKFIVLPKCCHYYHNTINIM